MTDATQVTRVAVCTVTHDSSLELEGFLEAIERLEHAHLRLIVVDCASSDGSLDLIESGSFDRPLETVRLSDNRGFAGGMNEALRHAGDVDYVLSLNPDARPDPSFLDRLIERADTAPDVGAVAGKLRRESAGDGRTVLDACGMYLSRDGRHLDRGSDEVDRGQYDEPVRVFGTTGAASLYRRKALDDVALEGGEIFDSLFHSYREDAELCFRLRARGWDVLYEPRATARHRRRNLPRRRREMSAFVNYHSLKNRYLLDHYHHSFWAPLPSRIRGRIRDVGIAFYVSLFERSSLEAYRWLRRHREQIRQRKVEIQRQRRVSRGELSSWYGCRQQPLGEH